MGYSAPRIAVPKNCFANNFGSITDTLILFFAHHCIQILLLMCMPVVMVTTIKMSQFKYQ